MRWKCVTDIDELSDYRAEWDGLRLSCGGAIYSSYRLSRLWLDAYREWAAPRILVVQEKSDIIGLAPLFAQSERVASIPIKMLSLIGQGGEFGYNNVRILTDPGHPTAMDGVLSGVKGLDWSLINFNHMEDGQLVQQLLGSARASWNVQELPTIDAIACPIPESGEVIDCFGKKTRNNIRNRIHKLEAEGGYRVRSVSSGEAGRAIEEYTRQHIERWKAKGGSIFQETGNVEFLKRVMEASISEGFGFGYELLIGDQVAAQNFGFLEGDLARGYMMGMNNTFAKYSPGLLLMALSMEGLRAKGVRVIDTGAGTEGYKQHLWGHKVPLMGFQAKRGMASFLSRLSSSPMGRRLDSVLGFKQRWRENSQL